MNNCPRHLQQHLRKDDTVLKTPLVVGKMILVVTGLSLHDEI